MDGNIGLQENVNIPEKANGFLSFPKNGFGLRLHVKLCRPLASGENVVCSSLSLNEGYYSRCKSELPLFFDYPEFVSTRIAHQ